MSDIAIFDPASRGALVAPDYFGTLFGDDANITPASSTPQLSIKGKHFRIVLEGNETLLTRRNPETGDAEPVSSLKIVVLNQGDRGARAYYEESYDSGGGGKAPTCFSLDGKVPDKGASQPQAATCATCPHSVKGSKMTPSGHPTTRCALQRRLAIVPTNDLQFTPLLLRLAATSSWDKDDAGGNNKQGWFAWQQYLDFLLSRGVRHTAQVVTMVKFDTTEYPKLLFKADRFLTQSEATIVAERINAPETVGLLSSIGNDIGSTAPDTPLGASSDAAPAVAPAPEPAPAPESKPTRRARQAAAPVEDAKVVSETKAAPAPAPTPAPAPAPAQAVPTAPATAPTSVEAVVSDILAAWDD